MDNDREKIVKEIAKTSDSIRKKFRSLKTGKMEENNALERHFKPISEPLKQLVENTVGIESDEEKIEPLSMFGDKKESLHGTERINVSLNDITSTPKRFKRRQMQHSSNASTSTPIQDVQPKQILHDKTFVEEIFETSPESLIKSVQQSLQTVDGQNLLRTRLGPLSQKYMMAILSQDKNYKMDCVYGVKFTDKGMILGDKNFDVDKNDNIIINGTKYAGTTGLYELIFKRLPDDMIYTDDDLQKYKSILLMTNAHRRNGDVNQPMLGNKGFKYKHIIAPLFTNKKFGRGIPNAMILNDNKIDYVHWNDPNELVDRLRLLEASRQAGNNAHDNEIMSIIEELYEAGIIIK